MNEITKLAFIDELEKIGFADFNKEAFLSALRMARATKDVAKEGLKRSGQQVKWGPGLGRSGQATQKVTAPSRLSSSAMATQNASRGNVLQSAAQ